MCGRFAFAASDKIIEDYYGISDARHNPRFNCTPSQNLTVITSAEPKALSCYKWGYIPSWIKDEKPWVQINARAESISEKPFFRQSFRHRRCLIPASAYYEWTTKHEKQPMLFFCPGSVLFSMAGIWDKWISKSGEILHTFAIITTAANKLVADIHERMPLILAHDQEEKWLLSENESEIIDLLKPFPADKMEYYPVSKALNNPAYDYASLTEKT